jgi:putative hemolysin
VSHWIEAEFCERDDHGRRLVVKGYACLRATGRDQDRFDAVADHLLVIDHAIGPGPAGVVATYRLIRA